MAEYVNYLRVFGAPGAARALFGAIQDDTAGLGSVDLNRITPMPVWMREEPLGAGTVRRQGGRHRPVRRHTTAGIPSCSIRRTPVCRC